MTTFWAPLFAFYIVGIFAYAVFNARALPPSVREIAAQDQVFAASVVLSTVGTAMIWPIAIVVLFGFALKARLEQRRLETPFFDRLQNGEHIEAIVNDMGGVERELELPELPPPPPCASCGEQAEYSEDRGTMNVMPGFDSTAGIPVAVTIDQIEMYLFCGSCTARITEGCTSMPIRHALPVVEAVALDPNFEDAP